jgi:PAS domain S-box-containing protein
MARRPGDMMTWLLHKRMTLAFSVVAGLALASTIIAIAARTLEPSAGYVEQARRVFIALATLAGVSFALLVTLLVERRRRAGKIRVTRDALQNQVADSEQTSALLASIVQSSDDAIIGLGPDGRVLTWNAGAERLYAYREEEIRDRPIATLSPSGQKDEVTASLRRVLHEQAVERFETEHETRDERRVRVFLTISPIRDVANAVVGASIVARDITARKLAEESLHRSEATSRAFLESASESIVVADAAGRVVLVNARTETMFGYARVELIGQPVEVLLPIPLRERHVAHRGTYMAAPRIRSMGRGLDLAGLKKDGTEFPVEVSLSYVETDEGMRAIAFITDISERVAFQKAARQVDKLAALGTLSAGIAHEINNPIGIITSRVEVMMLEAEEEGLPDEVRKDLEVILRHARRVATITQGLLSFARQSSGTRGPVNLNQVTEEIVQLVRKDMSRARVQVTTKLDEAMPTIVADANAIGQVLLNLLTNARRAMPEGGEITIETSHLPAARSVRVAVRDSGSGIPPEIMPKIFDPFFTTKPEGTGLGLSISHGIVHDHHGTLDVRSEVGKGSTFTLTFPVDITPGT